MELRNTCAYSSFINGMSQSLTYVQEQPIDAPSPIPNYYQPYFQPLDKLPPTQSDLDLLKDINMFESIKHPLNAEKFKCFKCFNQDIEDECDECGGTNYINHHHPLAHLLEQILIAKVPELGKKMQKSTNIPSQQPKNQLLFCSEVSITEEESCILQECRNCGKEEENGLMRYCDECENYSLCPTCYKYQKQIHPQHTFSAANPKINILEGLGPTMKKISEETQQEMSCTNEEINQIKCNSCQTIVEQCYQICLDCEEVGTQFVVCAECSGKRHYQHPHTHELAMRTINQASRLIRMESSPQYKQSQKKCGFFDKIAIPHVQSLDSYAIQKNTAAGKGFMPSVSPRASPRASPNQPDMICQKNQSESFFSAWEMSTNNAFLSSNSLGENNLFSDSFFPQNDKIEEEKPFNPEKVERVQSFPEDELDDIVPLKLDSFPQTEKPKTKLMETSIVNIECSLEMSSSIFNLGKLSFEPSQQQQKLLNFIPSIQSEKESPAVPKYKTMNNMSDEYLFARYQCDICRVTPIRNRLYHCRQCEDYDLCEDCFLKRSRRHDHRNFKMIDGQEQIKQRKDEMIQFERKNIRKSISPVKSGSLIKAVMPVRQSVR